MTALVTKEDIEGAFYAFLLPRISTLSSYYSQVTGTLERC